MAAKLTSVALVLLIGFQPAVPLFAQAPGIAGGQCSQVISQNDAELQAFQEQARNQTIDFARNDALSAASSGLKKMFENTSNATMELANKALEFKDRYEGYQAELERYNVTLKELQKCLEGKNCDVIGFAKRQSEVISRWLQSLLGEGLQVAIDRVRTASSLLQSYLTRLAGTAMGSMSAAVSCIDQYQKDAARNSQRPDPRDAVDFRDPQPVPRDPQPIRAEPIPTQPNPTPGASGGGGVSDGTRGLIALGAGLGALGAVAYILLSPSCTSQETATTNAITTMTNALNALVACGGNQSCDNSKRPAFNSAWNAAAAAIGEWCNCLGTDSGLSASEKASISQLWPQIRSMGLDPGTMPSCFR
jgi:hypothetical protein